MRAGIAWFFANPWIAQTQAYPCTSDLPSFMTAVRSTTWLQQSREISFHKAAAHVHPHCYAQLMAGPRAGWAARWPASRGQTGIQMAHAYSQAAYA